MMSAPDWLSQVVQLGALLTLGGGLLKLARDVGKLEQKTTDIGTGDSKTDGVLEGIRKDLGELKEKVGRIDERCEERANTSGVHYIGPPGSFDISGPNRGGNGGCGK